MATSLSEILYALQNGVRAINELKDVLSATSLMSMSAQTTTQSNSGTLVYNSSLASAFATIVTSSGGTYRIALLPSS
jgi:hypothetical protein